MSLTLAFNIARSGIASLGLATSVVSRNLANGDDPNAARKTYARSDIATVGTRGGSVTGAVDDALFERATQSTSRSEQLGVMRQALDELSSDSGAPATVIGELRSALQAAAAAPHDAQAARTVIASATTLAQSLNRIATNLASVRAKAQEDLASGMTELDGLLGRIEDVNRDVVRGMALGEDISDAVDRRNGLVREVAALVDIRATVRTGNDLVLHLADGTTLFETTRREIAFGGTVPLSAGLTGPQVRIDGVTYGAGDNLGGRLGGLLQVRDEFGLTYGRQLDEIARGLIVATSESDQSAVPTLPGAAGLFTYPGGPSLPPSGIASNGLAAQIRVNANVDPSQGGSLSRLRDGGIAVPGEPRYVYNPSLTPGYSARLLELRDRLTLPQPFDLAAGLTGSGSADVLEFAADSSGWLEGQRAGLNTQLEHASVLSQHALQAWQNSIGVNIDDELTKLIALERSFQASSRLIAATDGMIAALLKAVE